MATRFEFVHGAGVAERVLVKVPLAAASADVKAGHAIVADDSASGYYEVVDASGEGIVGVAVEDVDSPASDGGAYVSIDISENSYYRANPDTGSVTESLRFKTADIAADGASVNIDASATDNVKMHDVDVDRNEIIVSFIMTTYAGVA